MESLRERMRSRVKECWKVLQRSERMENLKGIKKGMKMVE